MKGICKRMRIKKLRGNKIGGKEVMGL